MGAALACSPIAKGSTDVTYPVPGIGNYVQASTPPPGPESWGPAIGVNGTTFYSYDAMGEDFSTSGGINFPADSGAAAGKVARWAKNTANLTVPADGLCSVSAGGVATATPTTGLYKSYVLAATVIPANSWGWYFLV